MAFSFLILSILCAESERAAFPRVLLIEDVLVRLAAVEGRTDTTEVVVTKVALDAEANDVQLDAQLRTELNAV